MKRRYGTEQSANELLLKPEFYRLGVLLYLEQRFPDGGLLSHRTELVETMQRAGWPVAVHLLREAANRLIPRMIAEATDLLLPEEPRHPNFDRGRFLEALEAAPDAEVIFGRIDERLFERAT